MILGPPTADDPLGESGEAEWERLSRQIELASGFWLAFMFVPSARVAGILRERVTRMLREEGKSVRLIRPSHHAALRMAIRVLLTRDVDNSVGCTWLEAVHKDTNTATERPWQSAWSDFLTHANEQRDVLRANVGHGLVVVAPPEVKPRVRELAPDLWHVRGIVIEIANEPDLPARKGNAAETPAPAGSEPAGFRRPTTGLSAEEVYGSRSPESAPTTPPTLAHEGALQVEDSAQKRNDPPTEDSAIFVFKASFPAPSELLLKESAPPAEPAQQRKPPAALARQQAKTIINRTLASPSEVALNRPDPPTSQPKRSRASAPPPADERAVRVSAASVKVGQAEREMENGERIRARAIAVEAAEAVHGDDPLVESRAWMVAAIAAFEDGDASAAADYAPRAIDIRRATAPEAVPVAWLVVKASTLMRCGRRKEGRKALAEAYRHARDRHARQPNLETVLDLANVLCWTGDLLLAEADPDRATQALEEAHRLMRTVDLSHDETLIRRDLEILLRLGDAYRQLGRDVDAEAVFELGTVTAQQRLAPRSVDVVALRDASVLFNRLGVVQLAAGDTDKAIECFQQAVSLRTRALAALDPMKAASSQSRQELCSALEKLAAALRAAGRDEDARATEERLRATRAG
ncbi:MAG: hypothetical protein U0441_29025 [Polyangiaceae bacterium]